MTVPEVPAGGVRADVAFGTVDQGAAAVLAFLFHAVAAAEYEVAVYGWLVLVWGTIGFGVLAWRAMIGVPFVVRYNESASPQGLGLLATVRVITRRIQATLGAAALMLVVWRATPVPDPSDPVVLFGAGFVVLVFALERELWRHTFIADLRTKRLGLVGLGANLGGVLAFVLGASVLAFPPALAVLLLAAGLGLGVWACRGQEPGRSLIGTRPRFMASAWSFGRHIMLGVVSSSGATQLILWGLLWVQGEEEVAVFGAVMALAGLPRPVLNAVTAVLTPRVTRHDSRFSTGSYRWSIAFGVVGGALLFAGVVSLLGPPVMRFIFPAVPTASVTVMVVLAVGIAVEGGNAVLRGVFRGVGVPEVEARAAVFGACAGLVSALALIPDWGLVGAAVAISVMQLGFFVIALASKSRTGGRSEASAHG